MASSSSSLTSSSSNNFSSYQNHRRLRATTRRIHACAYRSRRRRSTIRNRLRMRESVAESLVLRSSEVAVIGAILNLSGEKPENLGVQKNYLALALCPATKNCISTSEDVSDLGHYVPPWTYNRKRSSGRKKPLTREEAMEELLQAE